MRFLQTANSWLCCFPQPNRLNLLIHYILMVTRKSLTILFFLCIELTFESSSYFFYLITMILSNISENSNYIYSKAFIWLLGLVSLRISIPISKSGASLSWPQTSSNVRRFLVVCSLLYLRIRIFLHILLTEVFFWQLWKRSGRCCWGGEGQPQYQAFGPKQLNTGKGEGLPPNWSS